MQKNLIKTEYKIKDYFAYYKYIFPEISAVSQYCLKTGHKIYLSFCKNVTLVN